MSVSLHTGNAGDRVPLGDCRIALPRDPRLDGLAAALEQRGATLLRCPLSDTVASADAESVRRWLRDLLEQPPRCLALLSADGLRALVMRALELGMLGPFCDVLDAARVVAAGEGTTGVLRKLGMADTLPAGGAGVFDQLPHGSRVAVQLSGQPGDWTVVERLARRRLTLSTVMPCEPAPERDTLETRALVETIELGGIDALVLGRPGQWRRLLDVARAAGQDKSLVEGLRRATVAVTSAPLAEQLLSAGVAADIVWIEQRFTSAVINELTRRFRSPGRP
ncbi:MAG TPA: uroporphyrinogen-III synthase [Gammaproteobacteria bacterium]|nr:uroporphyrinogen-III synthase [Gammaproteobacteria bacterium]